MNYVNLLFRGTAALVLIQLALGGLLTFDFISPLPHIAAGFAVFVLAIASMIAANTAKPPFRPLKLMSVVLVLMIAVQAVLGFWTLETGNQAVAWVHFLLALGIYGLAISTVFMASIGSRLIKSSGEMPGSR